MSYTVIGMFDSKNQADAACRDLGLIGIDRNDIEERSGADTRESETFWEKLKSFFTGEDERNADYFAEGMRRGGTVVEVDAPEGKVDQVVSIFQRCGAVDVNNRAEAWRKSGWTGYSPQAQAYSASEIEAERRKYAAAGTATGAATQQVAVPVIEEELKLGKRQVQRGGVRICRHVSQKPVSEKINLREEHVDVQRRAVDRPLTTADAQNAFQDKTIEVTETAEEAVAAKRARVVEEVVVNKDVQQRQEEVRDTVRRTDVEVERLPGKDVGGRTNKDDQRTGQQQRTRANP